MFCSLPAAEHPEHISFHFGQERDNGWFHFSSSHFLHYRVVDICCLLRDINSNFGISASLMDVACSNWARGAVLPGERERTSTGPSLRHCLCLWEALPRLASLYLLQKWGPGITALWSPCGKISIFSNGLFFFLFFSCQKEIENFRILRTSIGKLQRRIFLLQFSLPTGKIWTIKGTYKTTCKCELFEQ